MICARYSTALTWTFDVDGDGAWSLEEWERLAELALRRLAADGGGENEDDEDGDEEDYSEEEVTLEDLRYVGRWSRVALSPAGCLEFDGVAALYRASGSLADHLAHWRAVELLPPLPARSPPPRSFRSAPKALNSPRAAHTKRAAASAGSAGASGQCSRAPPWSPGALAHSPAGAGAGPPTPAAKTVTVTPLTCSLEDQ